MIKGREEMKPVARKGQTNWKITSDINKNIALKLCILDISSKRLKVNISHSLISVKILIFYLFI